MGLTYNKVILGGNLTRDPEDRTFASGGRVAKFGLAVTNRKKNKTTGEWEDDPMFIDVEVFNRGDYQKNADFVMDKLQKSTNVLVEGRIELESWEDKNGGGKRYKHKLTADVVRVLGRAKGDGEEGGEAQPAAAKRTGAPAAGASSPPKKAPARKPATADVEVGEDQIPF